MTGKDALKKMQREDLNKQTEKRPFWKIRSWSAFLWTLWIMNPISELNLVP